MAFNPLKTLARAIAHTAPIRYLARGTDHKLAELGTCCGGRAWARRVVARACVEV